MHLGQRDKAPGAPPVNYFCDVSRIILGSVNGAPIGGTALPGPRKTAYHVTTICLRIYGSYQILRLIPLSQVGPYVVSWPPAPVNRDGCKGAGRGEGTNSERISGWLSG